MPRVKARSPKARKARQLIEVNDMTGLGRSLSQWFADSTRDWPPIAQPFIDELPVHAHQACPFLNCVRRAIVRQMSRVSSVGVLLGSWLPRAIVRRIGTIVVEAFNSMALGRPRTHVGVKARERFEPSTAYGNATRAVVLVVVVCGITAAGLHLAPSAVLGGLGQSMCFAQPAITDGDEAPAAACVSAAQAAASSDDYSAALTVAQPMGLASFGAGASVDRQKSKRVLCQIDCDRASHMGSILPPWCANGIA